MSEELLYLLLRYIENEIILNNCKTGGLPWQNQLDRKIRLLEAMKKEIAK